MDSALASNPTTPPPAPSPRRGRRWLRRAAVLLLVLAVLYFVRGPLLTWLARGLIVEEPAAEADYALLLGGDDCVREAARFYHARTARRLLLVRRRPGRLQQLGVLESSETRSRKALARCGVPEEAVVTLPGEAATDWDSARGLRTWLDDHPGVVVRAFCDRFGSRRKRTVLDRVLGSDDAARVRLTALREAAYDESDWGGTGRAC